MIRHAAQLTQRFHTAGSTSAYANVGLKIEEYKQRSSENVSNEGLCPLDRESDRPMPRTAANALFAMNKVVKASTAAERQIERIDTIMHATEFIDSYKANPVDTLRWVSLAAPFFELEHSRQLQLQQVQEQLAIERPAGESSIAEGDHIPREGEPPMLDSLPALWKAFEEKGSLRVMYAGDDSETPPPTKVVALVQPDQFDTIILCTSNEEAAIIDMGPTDGKDDRRDKISEVPSKRCEMSELKS